jgi:hypothetical protein
MSTDLSSYTSIVTQAIAAVTALVAAVAGLLAAARLRRRTIVAPATTLIYVASGSVAAPTGDLAFHRPMSGAPQGTVTTIPRWVSSTRTPLLIIVVLLIAIFDMTLFQRTSDIAPVLRDVAPVIADARVFTYDEAGRVIMLKVSGTWDQAAEDILYNKAIAVYARGVGDDVQNIDTWIKIGEGTLNKSGAWSVLGTLSGDGSNTATTILDTADISLAAIVVSPTDAPDGEKPDVKNTMTLAELDAYGRSQVVVVAVRREQPGAKIDGVGGGPSRTTPATGVPSKASVN